jgi:hypothetical protein
MSVIFVGCDFLCGNPIENPSNLVSKVLGIYAGFDENQVPKTNLGIWELALTIASWGELGNPTNPSFEIHVIIGNGTDVH